MLWDRIVTRWWSLQGGARYDFGGGAGKGWAALGVQGLAPYWINVEATVYAGDAGSLAARFKAETDLRFTQRLILQPELELNAYSRADRAREQGAGLSDVDAGLSSPRTWVWRGCGDRARAHSCCARPVRCPTSFSG